MKEDEARARLEARKGELDEISASSTASRRPVELDQQAVGRVSRVDALQMQAMAKATETRRQQERARIDAALARLDAGAWGYCVRCEEPIEPGRLQLDPAIPTCRACAG